MAWGQWPRLRCEEIWVLYVLRLVGWCCVLYRECPPKGSWVKGLVWSSRGYGEALYQESANTINGSLCWQVQNAILLGFIRSLVMRTSGVSYVNEVIALKSVPCLWSPHTILDASFCALFSVMPLPIHRPESTKSSGLWPKAWDCEPNKPPFRLFMPCVFYSDEKLTQMFGWMVLCIWTSWAMQFLSDGSGCSWQGRVETDPGTY